MGSWKHTVARVCALTLGLGSAAADAGWVGDYSVPRGCNLPVTQMAKLDSSRVILGGRFGVCGSAVAPKVVGYSFATSQFYTVGVGLAADPDDLPGLEPSAIVSDGSGQVYLAAIDGSSRLLLARTNASSTLEWIVSSAGPTLGGSPVAMDFAPDGSLYIASGNTVLRGTPGTVWSFTRLGGSNLFPAGGRINAIAYDLERAQVVVGGGFSSIAGTAANNIARWTGSAWAALPAVLDGSGVNGPVHALESVQGSTGGLANGLYLAGEFSAGMAEITQLFNIARYNGTGYNVLGASLSNRGLRGGEVREIRLNEAGTRLLSSGAFHTAGSTMVVNGVAQWDGGAWSGFDDVATGLGLDPGPTVVIEIGGRVLVGGDIDRSGGEAFNHLAYYQGGGWRSVGSDTGRGLIGTNFLGIRPGSAPRLLGGDGLFVGELSRIGLINTNNALRWEAATGIPRAVQPTTAGIPEFSAACADPGARIAHLFASGPSPFAAAGIGGPHAQLNLISGVLTAGGSNAAQHCAVSAVTGLVYSAHNNSANTAQIHAFNPATGASTLIGSVTGQVAAMAFDDLNQLLYIGGDLSNVSGVGAAHAARYAVTTATWNSLGGASAGFGLNAPVSAIGLDPARTDFVYFGGRFSSAGGLPQPAVARWNASSESWVPIANFCTAIDGACPSLLVEIRSLVPTSADGLVVGGDFASVDGGRSLLALADGSWRDAFGGGVFNIRNEPGEVGQLHLVDDQLVVAGQFVGRGRGSASAAASALAVFEMDSGPLPDPIFANGFD